MSTATLKELLKRSEDDFEAAKATVYRLEGVIICLKQLIEADSASAEQAPTS